MPRICDALVLAFSEGVSLRSWDEGGLLEREWALYERLRESVGRFVLVTYGNAGDRKALARLGDRVSLVCNETGLTDDEYLAAIADRVLKELGDARRLIVKTNQMSGGDAALRITAAARRAGLEVGLVARGGYLWSQFAACERGADSPFARLIGEREQRLCRGADVVVGTTRQMVLDLAWRHGVSEAALSVVPNYVIGDGSARVEGREDRTIHFAGRLERQKRIDRLIDAVALLPDDLRVSLSIVGAGSLEPQLRTLAAERGVQATFESRLPHRELLKRMRRCTIYAQTSAYEGHPKTVLEAMATGAPTIVVDEPGLRGVLRHGVTGVCVPPDPAAIAAGLEAMLRDPQWRATMGAAAAEQVRAECSLDRVVALETAVYERALRAGTAENKPEDAGEVRWDPALLAAGTDTAVDRWMKSIRGYARRLGALERAKFLASLDGPLYSFQGEAAIDAEGGLHPKHRVMRYHDFFVDRIRPGERVIDLGCGVGALAASIAERSRAHVTGMDWSESNLDQARRSAAERKLSIDYVPGDITTDRAPGTFGVVVLSNVLEHITDRPQRLRQWREWYGPDRFLIRVPAFDREWRVPWKKELGVQWRLDCTHETEYTQSQLEDELRAAGLKPTDLIVRWGEYWVQADPA